MPSLRRTLPITVAVFAALTLAGCASSAPSGPTVPMGPPATSTTESSTESTTSATAPEDALAELQGTWCPTDDSEGDVACFTVEGDELSVDGGPAWLETTDEGDGTFTLSLVDETGPLQPYGVFAPAGTSAGISDMYDVTDRPEEDRIFNGQTGILYVRS